MSFCLVGLLFFQQSAYLLDKQTLWLAHQLNLVPGRAHAADASVISLEPATVALEVRAGDVTTSTLYFVNQSNLTTTFEVLLNDYEVTDMTTRELRFVPAGTLSTSLQSFVSYEPRRFDLAPGKTQAITLRVSPLAQTIIGRYMGALSIGQVSLEEIVDQSASKIYTNARVASLIGVTLTAGAQSDRSTIANVRRLTTDYWPAGILGFSLAMIVFLAVWMTRRQRWRG